MPFKEVVVLKTTKRLELLSIKPWVDTFIEMENMNNNIFSLKLYL